MIEWKGLTCYSTTCTSQKEHYQSSHSSASKSWINTISVTNFTVLWASRLRSNKAVFSPLILQSRLYSHLWRYWSSMFDNPLGVSTCSGAALDFLGGNYTQCSRFNSNFWLQSLFLSIFLIQDWLKSWLFKCMILLSFVEQMVGL